MQSLSFRYRGISLLELMLALIVIAAILFTATRYYKITAESLRVEKAVTMTTNIINATHQWSETVPDISTVLSLQKLVEAGLIPQSYLSGNPWRGSLSVSAATNASFTIQMDGILPASSCENLLEKMQQYSAGPIPPCSKVNGKYTISMNFEL